MIKRVIGLLIVVAVVTGCSDDNGTVPSDGSSASANDGLTAPPLGTYVPSGEGGDSALLEGMLVLHEGCLIIENGEGRRVGLILPVDEVGWNGEELTWRGETYSPGDYIKLGGGFRTAKPESATVPAKCESETYFQAY